MGVEGEWVFDVGGCIVYVFACVVCGVRVCLAVVAPCLGSPCLAVPCLASPCLASFRPLLYGLARLQVCQVDMYVRVLSWARGSGQCGWSLPAYAIEHHPVAHQQRVADAHFCLSLDIFAHSSCLRICQVLHGTPVIHAFVIVFVFRFLVCSLDGMDGWMDIFFSPCSSVLMDASMYANGCIHMWMEWNEIGTEWNGQTNERTNERTDGRTDGHVGVHVCVAGRLTKFYPTRERW